MDGVAVGWLATVSFSGETSTTGGVPTALGGSTINGGFD